MKALIFFVFILLNQLGHALPKNFVYLHDIAPDIIEDIRYATANNFIGNKIPGYKRGVCILTKHAAQQLKKAQAAAKTKGYTIKVYDCYRPQKSVNYFYRWSKNSKDQRHKAAYYPRVKKADLFKEKYIAHSSGHSRGSTIDLTLVPLHQSAQSHIPMTRCYAQTPDYNDDNSIDTGTRFDCLDKRANLGYSGLSMKQKENRKLLKTLMIANGFKPYFYEWWHFTLNNEPYPDHYFNFSVK